ncbi:hypothetical protein TeGR_g9063 [Tetraparma gracilis]|uniref:Uncharacterized protein n=1 Tax=Tetraparma gracilis TaxID=2962635 RepID=A0ABQ6MEA2_9STRA|nr:hypothetical protein TeGR_g9063 [Tetraparma gracilis]
MQLSVCAGATCSSSCLSPLTSLAAAWGSAVEVRSTDCLGACGKGPNVGVLKGSGSGVSLPGMTEPERLRRCFMKATGEEGAERIGGEVDEFLAGEPARALAAQAALAKPAAPLKNPGCEAADVVARVLALSGRDVSERGYGRDKLLKLLRERCGPLGGGEADELGG